MAKPPGAVAVIFVNQRSAQDSGGYGAAAAAMEEAAARQPGYLGIASVRDANGFGITISYWADEAAARAWRADPAHRAVIAQGQRDWYERYEVIVADVTRSYDWDRETSNLRSS